MSDVDDDLYEDEEGSEPLKEREEIDKTEHQSIFLCPVLACEEVQLWRTPTHPGKKLNVLPRMQTQLLSWLYTRTS
ncbi:hypothetical protein GOODEAATRI_012012 [Goodea atripinnis]|uniref:Uncharacterized protein n=1 Tax=Goodea atripinnis TaxID=208336 RepID=A0ABV0P3G6_9TELE